MKPIEEIDFFSAEVLRDPFGFYERARVEKPVIKAAMQNFDQPVFVVTSYELVREVFQNHQLYSSDFVEVMMRGAEPHPEADELFEAGIKQGSLLLTLDEPTHRGYRSLVSTAFTPKQAAGLLPKMEEIIHALIDNIIERGSCDFIEEIAVPYPIYVIADLLGYDRAIYPKLRLWSDAFLVRLSQRQSKAEDLQAVRDILEFQAFNNAAIAEHRERPRDDLISQVIQARVAGIDPLTDREALVQLQEIGVAGNETSRNTLVGGLVLLLRDRELLARLRADPALVPNAVEEILRITAATAGMWRIAKQDTVLGGVEIPAGSIILVRMDSANLDPAKFPNPYVIDVERRNRHEHLSFGSGIHYCLGNFISRHELTVGFRALIERLDEPYIIEEKSDLSSPPSVLHRSVKSLHIGFKPGRRRQAQAA